MLFNFWELFPVLLYEALCRYFLYYSDSQCAKKNFAARIPLLGALCSTFGPILGIFLNDLRNLKDSLDILHECIDITAVVTKLKNVSGFPLLWTFCGVCGTFCTCPQLVGNHLTFPTEVLRFAAEICKCICIRNKTHTETERHTHIHTYTYQGATNHIQINK